jgi:EAL domain-containing protein (putative c-di-GMP-specific phosphodiesterase class I)
VVNWFAPEKSRSRESARLRSTGHHGFDGISGAGVEHGMTAMPRRLGRVVVLSERRSERVDARRTAPGLEALLGDRTLGVHFQPIVTHVQGGWRATGAEALVRAYSPRGPVLRPDRLLPIVERAGLLDRLFAYVLAESLAALRDWERRGCRFDVAVNLHAGALLDDALPGTVVALLELARVAPGRLTIELTERSPIPDLRRAAANLRRLRSAGVRTALDDFGAGFSTHMRLARFEFDELKIDRALVQGLEHCEEQRCVVESLVGLAHSRGMAACAEGVETAASLRLLQMYGCDRAQGWYVARPLTADALPAFVAGWRQRAAEGEVAHGGVAQLTLPGLGTLGYTGT